MSIFRHRVSGPGSAGDVWVSTLHTQGAASIDEAHNAWVEFITIYWARHLQGMWATSTSANEAVTDQLDDITWKNVAQRVGILDLTGTSTGGAPSPRSCLVVGLRTGLPTRAGRGRMFLPSPSTDHYTATGKFAAADTATIATDFSLGLNTMRATVTPIIAHRSSHTWDQIIRVTVGDIPGTQRRRTNKDAQAYASFNVV